MVIHLEDLLMLMMTRRRMTMRWRTTTRWRIMTMTTTTSRISQLWDWIGAWGVHEDIKGTKGIDLLLVQGGG